jgi:hypothetical protein
MGTLIGGCIVAAIFMIVLNALESPGAKAWDRTYKRAIREGESGEDGRRLACDAGREANQRSRKYQREQRPENIARREHREASVQAIHDREYARKVAAEAAAIDAQKRHRAKVAAYYAEHYAADAADPSKTARRHS